MSSVWTLNIVSCFSTHFLIFDGIDYYFANALSNKVTKFKQKTCEILKHNVIFIGSLAYIYIYSIIKNTSEIVANV